MRRKSLPFGIALLASTLFFPAAEAQDRECGKGRGGLLEIVGLTSDQRLICFSQNNPGRATTIGEVEGLTGDSRLVGIDFRPATGDLYALGDAGGLYVLDIRNGEIMSRSQLSVALSGTSFGVDFNPTVDRLRIVSNTGQNLRVNVETGAATVDTNLTYPPDAANGAAGAAYTNNDSNASTSTTLYVIDAQLDQVVIQAPPNAGSLNATGKLTIDAGGEVGFDIFSRMNGGTTVENHAFATLSTGGGRARLYGINLLTGRAIPRGAFRAQHDVVDIAVPTLQRAQ